MEASQDLHESTEQECEVVKIPAVLGHRVIKPVYELSNNCPPILGKSPYTVPVISSVPSNSPSSSFTCHHCHEITSSKTKLKYHIIRCHFPIYEFQCHVCASIFESYGMFRHHCNTAHDIELDLSSNALPYFCDLCSTVCSSEAKLQHHVTKTHPALLSCTLCTSQVFTYMPELRNHYMIEHGAKGAEAFIYTLCHFVKDKIRKRKFIDKKGYDCDICLNMTFRTCSDLQDHILVSHYCLLRFHCRYCDHLEGTKEQIRHHIREKHASMDVNAYEEVTAITECLYEDSYYAVWVHKMFEKFLSDHVLAHKQEFHCKYLDTNPVFVRTEACKRRFSSELDMLGHFTMFHSNALVCRICHREILKGLGDPAFARTARDSLIPDPKVILPADNSTKRKKTKEAELNQSLISSNLKQTYSPRVQKSKMASNKRNFQETKKYNRHIILQKYLVNWQNSNYTVVLKKINSVVSNPKFSCFCCFKQFLTRVDLAHHVLGLHTGIRRFQCPRCEKKYYFRSGVENHCRLAHGSEKQEDYQYLDSIPDKNVNPCEHCDKIFWSENALNMHCAIKHSDSSIKCSKCSAYFARSSGLQIHMRNHLDDQRGFTITTSYTAEASVKQENKSSVSDLNSCSITDEDHESDSSSTLSALSLEGNGSIQYHGENPVNPTAPSDSWSGETDPPFAVVTPLHGCLFCAVLTTSKEALWVHMDAEHHELYSAHYKCVACSFETGVLEYIKVHWSTQHSDTTPLADQARDDNLLTTELNPPSARVTSSHPAPPTSVKNPILPDITKKKTRRVLIVRAPKSQGTRESTTTRSPLLPGVSRDSPLVVESLLTSVSNLNPLALPKPPQEQPHDVESQSVDDIQLEIFKPRNERDDELLRGDIFQYQKVCQRIKNMKAAGSNNNYPCYICLKAFRDTEKMKSHILKKHLNLGRFCCRHCNFQNYSMKVVMNHYCSTCHGVGGVNCCLSRIDTTQEPKSLDFLPLVQFQCKFCNAKFNIGKNLKSHLQNEHMDKNFKALPCTMHEYISSVLENHALKEHPTLKYKYPSEPEQRCNAAYRSISELAAHISVVHSAQMKCTCCEFTVEEYAGQDPVEICHAMWEQENMIEALTPVLTQNRYVLCTMCGVSYSTYPGLRNHILHNHFQIKRFKCIHCSFADYSSAGIAQHNRNVHPGNHNMVLPLMNMVPSKSEQINFKSYSCNFCHLKFYTIQNLHGHLKRIHKFIATESSQMETSTEPRTHDNSDQEANSHTSLEPLAWIKVENNTEDLDDFVVCSENVDEFIPCENLPKIEQDLSSSVPIKEDCLIMDQIKVEESCLEIQDEYSTPVIEENFSPERVNHFPSAEVMGDCGPHTSSGKRPPPMHPTIHKPVRRSPNRSGVIPESIPNVRSAKRRRRCPPRDVAPAASADLPSIRRRCPPSTAVITRSANRNKRVQFRNVQKDHRNRATANLPKGVLSMSHQAGSRLPAGPRRVTSLPYPPGLPSVPGDCLPCTVQLEQQH